MSYSTAFGWLSLIPTSREHPVEPPAHISELTVGQPWPNWTGFEWKMPSYVAPLVAPVVVVKVWKAYDFLDTIPPSERIAIRSAAKTDPIAEDFMHLLNSAIAGGVSVRSDSANVIAGLNYLRGQNKISVETLALLS